VGAIIIGTAVLAPGALEILWATFQFIWMLGIGPIIVVTYFLLLVALLLRALLRWK